MGKEEKKVKIDITDQDDEVSVDEEKVEELTDAERQLVELKERNEVLEDRLMRQQAEFENYRKRIQKERPEVRHTARAEIIGRLLPILDACEKALDSLRGEAQVPDPESYKQGFSLLLKELETVLERYDVTSVPGVGSDFDPNLHEAVTREVSDDHPDGQVVEEYRKGYLIGERLLRPAQVKVAVRPD